MQEGAKMSKSHFGLGWGFFSLSKNKTFEYQIDGLGHTHSYFELSFKWNCKSDHSGPDFIFGIYKLFWININIHDNRHWNYDKDAWEIYPGESQSEEDSE